MKRYSLLLWPLCLVFGLSLGLTACSDEPEPSGGGGVVPGTSVNPTDMRMASLRGFVRDVYGSALSGVTVTSGTATTTTNAEGAFVLQTVNVQNGRTVVRFAKEGYFDVVRAAIKQDGDAWEVAMNKTMAWDGTTARETYPSTNESTLSAGDMSVELAANSYKNAETGAAYEGNVQAEMLYLSPDNSRFADLMPGGDLAAVRSAENGGGEVQLISYGMISVNLTDGNGKRLQLADGKPAKLKFPIPESLKENTPAEIPLWSFNETTGLWEEEGVARLNGDVYEGEAKHFSWINLDWPQVRATLNIVLEDEGGNRIPYTKVHIDQVSRMTDAKGEISMFVPALTTIRLTVRSEDYGRYTPERELTISGTELSGGSTKTVKLTLPKAARLSGQIVNQSSGSKVATVWVESPAGNTKYVQSDLDGNFYLMAPVGYTGPAVLNVRSLDGQTKSINITLDGTDQAFTVTINAASGSGGAIRFTDKTDGTVSDVAVSAVKEEELDGVYILDTLLVADIDLPAEEGEHAGLSFQISPYRANQTRFENCRMDYHREGQGQGFFFYSQQILSDVSVANGLFTFKLSGNGHGNQSESTVAAEFSLPLALRAYSRDNVVASDNLLPSITPYLSIPATKALIMTESPKLGKGGILAYDKTSLTIEDFRKLKAQAKQKLGSDPFKESEQEHDERGRKFYVASAKFFKDGKFVEINYNGYSGGQLGDVDFGWLNGHLFTRLSVTVCDNVKVPLSEITSLDNGHHR